MHTLSHFQAKKTYTYTHILIHAYIHVEREEKCGLFQRNKKANFFLFEKAFVSLSIPSCSCLHPENKRNCSFMMAPLVSLLHWMVEFGREKKREKEAKAPQERHACLCVVPFCMFFNLSHSLPFCFCHV